VEALDPGIERVVRETTREGDAYRWASTASQDGFDLVMAIGGDGTFREAVSGIIEGKQSAVAALIPAGTANAVAVALDLHRNPKDAAKMIETGTVEDLDVGYLPDLGRYFTVMAAIGFAARMIEESTQKRKNRFGIFAYLIAFVKSFVRRDHARIELQFEDGHAEMQDAHTILIANIGRFEHVGLTVSPQTSPFDGSFDVVVASDRTPWQTMLSVLWILFRRHRKAPTLRTFRAKRVRLTAVPTIPVQIDGELAGTTPVVAEVIPGAVRMLLPRS
jgi:YegS/Rv2252/BmrU family lipid kinase